MDRLLIYPTIFTENNDEDGHYFTVTSPNIEGMITEGDTREKAAIEAVDAIATMLDGEVNYPEVQDPNNWHLELNESIVYITVNMTQWYVEKARVLKTKTVRRTITLPEYINDLAKERGLNVSRIASEALEKALKMI
jgi:predicted RNase H-like HicB family nuclease